MSTLRAFLRQLVQGFWSRSVQRMPRRRLQFDRLEDRTVPSTVPLRSWDGTGNNLAHPEWGSTGVAFLRLAPAEYGDGVASVGGVDRPSARVISNSLAAQGDSGTTNERMLSAMVYAWGQFIDHDLDLTFTGTTEPLQIPVPSGDPFFDPQGTGTQVIATTRSVFDPATGTGTNNPRQQVNAITAWIDGSMVYGSDAATAASLRTFVGGRMKTSAGNLLPVDAQGNFIAGDVRVNENPELTSIHTLFVREHNYWADRLARETPGLTDEELYQQARGRVIGEIQAITYNQWLPAILGPQALGRYTGYNASVNPGISNEFATAGFRFGHSLLGDSIEFLDNQGKPVADSVSLADAFFHPELIQQYGIDAMLKYLSSDPASELDTRVVDSVRNFLFGPPGAGGLDLASLNIQRGRDHGLADYNATRVALGLPRVTTFAQITANPQVQGQLKLLYGSIDNIDLWVGALAEDHVPGGSVGPTIRAILADQFGRLRDGDRFWYQAAYSGPVLGQLQQTTLADVLRRNTNLTNLQGEVFYFRANISGTVFVDGNRDGKLNPGDPLLANRLVQLVDRASGQVTAQTRTDLRGLYRFDVRQGLATGEYVVQVLASNGKTVLATSRPVAITRGDQFFNNHHVAVAPSPSAGSSTRPAPTRAPRSLPVQPMAGTESLADVVNLLLREPRR